MMAPSFRSVLVVLAAAVAPVFGGPVGDKVADRYVPVGFGQERVSGGVLADRMKVNLEERLLKVDEKALLEGFLHRPGSHPWIGEHAGKFLHAAACTYAYTHDERLKTLMDRIATTLIGAQTPDGYLGTYADDQRWTSWDVWSHKYDMIGLLAWYDVTHDERALECCRKIGDLLCATFGDEPGKKDLSDSGTQDGMAPTSVLEPMCYLYRHTGEKKYLDFCFYITRNIEKHSKLISSLTAGRRVDQTSNAKAYEMLSNLLGLVELYRITGDEQFLVPAVKGWESIVDGQLYLSGTTSAFEHFRGPGVLPAGAPDNVGEGCVTVTWEQLNLSLLRLTGEAKYGDQLERTIYNALLAAQNAESGDICYFTPLVGPKPYTHEICCCLSSEPRGIALIPQVVYGVEGGKAIVVNLYAAGGATFDLEGADGKPVTVKMECQTTFPKGGEVTMRFEPSREVAFDVLLREPSWGKEEPNTYNRVTVDPAKSKEVKVSFDMTPRAVPGGKSYPTCFAIERGPQVLALEPSVNPNLPMPAMATVTELSSVHEEKGGYVFRGACSVRDVGAGKIMVAEAAVTLVPFSDATHPIVWMPTREHLATGALPVTWGGVESQSRPQKHQVWMPDQDSITDLRADTYRTTHNRRHVDQDWYAVELKKPATIRRVVFVQGAVNNDGGWFDASAGKPKIQVRTGEGKEWKTVGTLESYPDTTARDAKGLAAGRSFEVVLEEPVEASAVRILGKGSEGDNPKNCYSCCAELDAYAE